MKKILTTICSLVLLTISFIVEAKASVPQKFEEINIFNFTQGCIKKISSSTCSWIKDSNYLPKLILNKNNKAIEFTYLGTKGMARSNISCAKLVKEQVDSGKTIVGVKVVIDCKNDDTGKIDFMAFSKSGTLVKTVILKSGTNGYIFRSGHTIKKPDWNLLTFLGIWNKAIKGYTKKFSLKQISLLVKEAPASEK